MFLDFGITASLDIIVERSGLGRATLYRHFTDRTALVLALVDASLERLERFLAALPPGTDRWLPLVRQLGEEMTINPALADAWRVIDPRSEVSLIRQRRFCEMFEAPLTAALKSGLVRPDLRTADMILLVGMIGTAVREKNGEARQAMIARLLDLILTGVLRARGGGL